VALTPQNLASGTLPPTSPIGFDPPRQTQAGGGGQGNHPPGGHTATSPSPDNEDKSNVSHRTKFHTVQNAADRNRLKAGGEPWPTSPTKAHLGTGVYAWSSAEDANTYLNIIKGRETFDPTMDPQVVSFSVDNSKLSSYSYLNLDRLGDPGADEWLDQYSALRGGDPSQITAEWIQRGASERFVGPENFFSDYVLLVFMVISL
jgi:hypothetical protein